MLLLVSVIYIRLFNRGHKAKYTFESLFYLMTHLFFLLAKDVDRVQLLLDRGCDVDIPNNTGASPLHISNDYGTDKIVHFCRLFEPSDVGSTRNIATAVFHGKRGLVQ